MSVIFGKRAIRTSKICTFVLVSSLINKQNNYTCIIKKVHFQVGTLGKTEEQTIIGERQ